MLARLYRHVLLPGLRLAWVQASARRQGLRAFKVLGSNMEPTLALGEVALYAVLADARPTRGEVVVVKHPSFYGGDPVPLRVLGLPGDVIEIRDGDLLIHGSRQPEPYLPHGTAQADFSRAAAPVQVREGHVWLLGDCRDNSNDSRQLGPMPLSAIVGRIALVRPLADSRQLRAVR